MTLFDDLRSQWPRTFRTPTAEEGNEMALPAIHVVPTPGQTFHMLFYWDTYYTLLGLNIHGYTAEARGSVECLMALGERLGFVPNMNLKSEANRSQPPHLALMVRDLLAQKWDADLAHRALAVLEMEWRFWWAFRTDESGLAAYGTHAGPDYLLRLEAWELSQGIKSRTGLIDPPPGLQDARWSHRLESIAECESGWDYTPRFLHRCRDHLAVDLNALLFAHERICSDLAERLGREQEAVNWRERADLRKKRMNHLLWHEKIGAFVDRDRIKDRLSARVSAASWYPVWLGVASPEQMQSSVNALRVLEMPHGVVPTAPGHGQMGRYQWDHPNAWAPHQWATMQGLLAAGDREGALRIAKIWIATVERNHANTGRLWEKYNAVTGTNLVVNEYEMPEMLGWTAGVYVACVDLVQTLTLTDEGSAAGNPSRR